MTRKQKRLAVIGGLAAVLAVATGLFVVAVQNFAVYFYSPSEVREKAVAVGTMFRLGGLIEEGSWTRSGEVNDFVVTDGAASMPVRYVGIVPDLFKEGTGVVAEGTLAADGSFAATTVLAKHDENYMPKEVVDSLKERGEWQREAGP